MSTTRLTAPGNPNVMEINRFLTPEECQELLSAAKAKGFEPTGFDPSQRKAERLHTIDPKLSASILKRLRAFLPEIIVIDGVRWRLNRFTHHWRYVHYTAGGKFRPHFDGVKLLPWHEMSVFTVQIYLNQNYTGGSTRFYLDYVAKRQAPHKIGYGVVNDFAPKGPHTHAVKPTTGKALVFNHTQNVLHDGEEVLSGEKDILRGDILYSALPEDIHLLENPKEAPENRIWTKEVAAHGGTRSYIGEVWQCGCGNDFCGMKMVEPLPTKRLLYRNGEKLEFFNPGGKKLVKGNLAYILINGKRASGKDHIANKLQQALEERGYKVCRSALGAINKRDYANKVGIDVTQLESDRAFKETHRLAMIAHHEARNAKDPEWALKQVVEQARSSNADVLLLSDLRTLHDLRWFQAESAGEAVFIRIDASETARKARGWVADPAKDNLKTEVDLDNYTGWMSRFDNSDNTEKGAQLTQEWIRHTILPRLGEDI